MKQISSSTTRLPLPTPRRPMRIGRQSIDTAYAGSDPRDSTGDGTTTEADARRGWEQRHRGTWEERKDAIGYAWDKVRGRR
jgi:hypothetical protein